MVCQQRLSRCSHFDACFRLTFVLLMWQMRPPRRGMVEGLTRHDEHRKAGQDRDQGRRGRLAKPLPTGARPPQWICSSVAAAEC